jgi:putative hemin transport protein
MVLEAAARDGLPIMVFVNNPGCIQIHTGPVAHLKTAGPWFNVLDPDFNLHLREDLVKSAWVVRKPTSDGFVTSLELYDATEGLVVQFFGKRKPGQSESLDWRRIVEGLCATAPV